MCQSSCGTSVLDDGGAGTMMPQPRPCLLGWRTPFELWTPVTPPAAVLQRTSSTEQLLRMYNGNSLLQPASYCFHSSDSSSELWTHCTIILSLAFNKQRLGQRRTELCWAFFCKEAFESSPIVTVVCWFLIFAARQTPNKLCRFAAEKHWKMEFFKGWKTCRRSLLLH